MNNKNPNDLKERPQVNDDAEDNEFINIVNEKKNQSRSQFPSDVRQNQNMRNSNIFMHNSQNNINSEFRVPQNPGNRMNTSEFRVPQNPGSRMNTSEFRVPQNSDNRMNTNEFRNVRKNPPNTQKPVTRAEEEKKLLDSLKEDDSFKPYYQNKQIDQAKSNLIIIAVVAAVAILCIIGAVFLLGNSGEESPNDTNILDNSKTEAKKVEIPDWIEENLLTPNEYSRPQTPLKEVNGIVVHYVANPGTTAEQNRNYFESLAQNNDSTYGSSNFIIDLDGGIMMCVPVDEVAYASNERNNDTLSIECTHPDETGEFTEETYNSLVKLCRWILDEYGLDESSIIRHYDITGKICPKFFVDNPDKWEQFLTDVKNASTASGQSDKIE